MTRYVSVISSPRPFSSRREELSVYHPTAPPTTYRRERRSSTHRPIGSRPRGSRRSSTSYPPAWRQLSPTTLSGGRTCSSTTFGRKKPPLRTAPHGHHHGPATSAGGGGVEETFDQDCGNFCLQQHFKSLSFASLSLSTARRRRRSSTSARSRTSQIWKQRPLSCLLYTSPSPRDA